MKEINSINSRSSLSSVSCLDMLAQNIIKKYDADLLKSEPQETPLEEIIEFNHGIKLIYTNLSKDKTILGITIFEDCAVPVFNSNNNKYECFLVRAGTILIDESLLETSLEKKYKFTLAHEFAHWLIHASYYQNSNDIANKSARQKHDDEIEEQADMLALSLLLPRGRLKVAYERVRHKFKRNVALLILADTFNVSVADLSKRLQDLNLARIV